MRHRLTRVLPWSPVQLFGLVADVERYPRFVPWITTLTVCNRKPLAGGGVALDAEAAVRFSIVRERFSTRVATDPAGRTIEVRLISGPFRRLSNRWRFEPHPQGCRLHFEIDFEFASRLLSALLAANSGRAADRLIACFEARARDLFGAGRPAARA